MEEIDETKLIMTACLRGFLEEVYSQLKYRDSSRMSLTLTVKMGILRRTHGTANWYVRAGGNGSWMKAGTGKHGEQIFRIIGSGSMLS